MDDYVVSTGAPWSEEERNLTSIQIGDGVTSIGNLAFRSCINVESITIPFGVTNIGSCAFEQCTKLERITIPPGVTSIGSGAFFHCINLTRVTIPSGTETIEDQAFFRCDGLTRVDLPSSLTSVGEKCFHCCDQLADVYFAGTKAQWDKIADPTALDDPTKTTVHCHSIITFDANGHGTAPEPAGQWPGQLITNPGNLTAGGYTFTGWYQDKACTQKWDFASDTVGENDMTLYAGWKEAPKPDPEPTPDQKQDPAPTSDSILGNLTTLESKAEGLKEKDDLKGSTFHILQLKAKKVGKTSIKLGWKRVPGAAGYVVYGAGCGSRLVKLGDVTGTAFTHTGLKKGTYYRCFVAAYDANGNILAISKIAHIATNGGKKGNPKSVSLNKKTVTLKKKHKFQLKAKLHNGNKKVSMHRKIAFETDKPKVATVSKSGKIKAVGKGSCTIYVYAQNGVFAKCRVRVK